MPPEISALSDNRAASTVSHHTRKLRIGLLGASGYGTFHLNSLLSFQQEGRVELAAVADPAMARLPEVRASLESKQIPFYESPAELIQKVPDLEAVSIAAPIPWHEQLCREALSRDLFLFLEKPPVPLIQQWDSVLKLDASRRITVAFQNIASKPIQDLKKWCVEGRLGKIQSIRVAAAWRREDVYYTRNNWAGKLLLGEVPVLDGPATNAMAHLIHDSMFLASPDPTGFAIPLEVTAELYRARPIESYDSCCLRATLQGGIELTVAMTHACEKSYPYQIVVTGSKGSARIHEDGTILDNDQGWPRVEEMADLYRNRCYENFIQHALGQSPQVYTSFADTRGYILLTNGMILSSSNIHPIPPSFTTVTGTGPQTGYCLENAWPLLQATLESGKLFSEQGVPWAVPGKKFSLENLSNLSLRSFLPA